MTNSLDDAPWFVKLGAGAFSAIVAALQPWHVIALGLAIAVIGVIWQIRYTPPPEAPAKEQAKEPASAPTPSPLKRMFTTYDVEQRLRCIDELYELLSTRVMAVSADGERLNHSLPQKIKNGTAIDDLTRYADATEKELTNYFETAGRFQIFPDIYHDATALVWNPLEIVSSSRNLVTELQRLDGRGQSVSAMDYLQNNKFMAEFNSATSGKFWTWINEKQQLLTKKRREYEAAEVYPK